MAPDSPPPAPPATSPSSLPPPPDPPKPVRKRKATTIWVDPQLRDQLQLLIRGREDLNDVVWRLYRQHGQQVNAGSLNTKLLDAILSFGKAGQSLDDVVYMMLVHFRECKGPGGAGTVAGYVEARQKVDSLKKQREHVM